MMYLFDPTQFAEFGHLFFQGDSFSYRYQLSKKLFWKSIYIPLGPNCETKQGFDNFLNHVKSQKFTKIKIDLPMIYDPKQSKAITDQLQLNGFKKSEYVFQDEETLLVMKADLNLPGSKMKRVRYGMNRANIIVKDNLNGAEIDQIYGIYLSSAEKLGIVPKDKAAFDKLAENCLVSLAYDKETSQLEGYLLCYFVKTNLAEIAGKTDGKLLLAMFTGLTDKGRDYKLGHAIHFELFKQAFDNYGVDVIDFHGASRNRGRSYIEFKQVFSERFVSLPGSFIRTRYF